LGNDNSSKIFEYTVDETAKSYRVKIYTLDENLEWKEKVSSFGRVEDVKGRIAISINEDQGIRVAFQYKNAVSAWASNAGLFKDITNKTKIISWVNTYDIIYEQEIPLAIQIITSLNEIRDYGVESFFDIQKLKGHDIVIAVTITFSQKGLEQILIFNKHTRTFIMALLIIALLITLYLVIMAIAFGNTHPPASPVPIN